MIFLGRTFCGARNSLDSTPTELNNITQVTVGNGVYDDVYVSGNANREYAHTIPNWGHETTFHATFQDSLQAGNVDFTLSQVSSILVKRRIKGTFDWVNLFQIPVNSLEDLTFEKYDRYAAAKTEYEYSLVPELNGAEGTFYINSVLSDFDGVFIIEKNAVFHTPLDLEVSSQRNKPVEIVNTLGRKYPYVISNSLNNYSSGTITATFIERDSQKKIFKVEEGFKFRHGFMDFLQNGVPKILKLQDGQAWIIMVTENPSEVAADHPDKISTTFSFTEIADINSSRGLYDNDFIDVDL